MVRKRSARPLPLTVVVLAAGEGRRMHSHLPKVLQPLAGRPLLAHVLDAAWALEPAALFVVYGHGGEQVRAAFSGAPVQWVMQSELRGTGHALLQALPAIPDDHLVLVLYGDVPLIRTTTLRELLGLAGARRVALLTALSEDASGYGRVVRDARARVRRVVEHADANAQQRRIREFNSGVLAAPARLLHSWLPRLRPHNAQLECYLTDIVAMAARSRVGLTALRLADGAEVQGVNDRSQLAAAEAHYRRRRAEELMAAGATIADPARIDLRGEVTVGRDVFLDVNVVLEGPVRLGDRVRVGPCCVLQNVQAGADTEFIGHCVVQGAHIGGGCRIGPFTRIRPGTRLHDRVHLGNFVEAKNSDIGEGSKVNHLSYVGDADVGSGVNIGAGTITCNYDGAHKWRTAIGNRAFVGSGSMLVAPVSIGEGATIGAGSTITADAPAGKLTLARTPQATVEQWIAPAARGGKR